MSSPTFCSANTGIPRRPAIILVNDAGPEDLACAAGAGRIRRRCDSVAAAATLLRLPAAWTRIGIEGSGKWWLYAALAIVVAIAGKLGGSMFAARFAGMSWRDSASLGILMNTRGLMELVILNMGLGIGVISCGMFSMMVLMALVALVTTFMTTPLLHLVYPQRLVTEGRIRLMPERVA